MTKILLNLLPWTWNWRINCPSRRDYFVIFHWFLRYHFSFIVFQYIVGECIKVRLNTLFLLWPRNTFGRSGMLEIKSKHGILLCSRKGKMCVFSRERKKENTHTLKYNETSNLLIVTRRCIYTRIQTNLALMTKLVLVHRSYCNSWI